MATHVVDGFTDWGTGPDRLTVGGTRTTTVGMPEHQNVTISPRIDLGATNVASGNESFELKVDGKLIRKIEYRRATGPDGVAYMYPVSTFGDGVTFGQDSGGNEYYSFAHTNSSMTVSVSASGITNVANTVDQDYWSFRMASVVARNPDIAVYPAGDMYEGGGWDTPDGSGGFGLVRNGPLETAFTVYFRMTGAAIQRSPSSLGPDYHLTGDRVTFGAVRFEPYQQFATITAVPFDDTDPEWLERATLTLKDGIGYDLDPNSKQATIFLYDNDGGGGDPWGEEPPEEQPPLPPDPDDERPDFTTNITLGGKGGEDAGNTDPGDNPPDGDGSGDGTPEGETREVFIPVNDDFDEQNKDAQGNLIPDSLPDATAGDRLLPADDEVLYGAITFSSDRADQGGRWVLNFSDEQIAVWAKGDAVGSPNAYRKLQPGELFTATTIPFSVALAVEALMPSHMLDDVHLMARLIPNAGGMVSDTMHLTGWGWQMVEVDENGQTSEADYIEPSHPAPTIELTGTVTNVSQSMDGRITGTITISGTVDSDTADATAGDPGKIDVVDVFVNGKLAKWDTIPVTTTEKLTDGPSLRRPYDFSGTFSKTYNGVELDLGDNVIEVRASDDKVFGITGIAEMRFPVAYGQDGQPFAGSVSCIGTKSDGTKTYLLRIDGPNDMAAKIASLNVGTNLVPLAKGSDGKLYVGDPSTPVGAQPKPAVLQLHERMQNGQIPGLVNFDDTSEFLSGVIVGFAEGGWSLVTGTVQLVVMGVMNQAKYSPLALGVRWLNGDQFQSERQQFYEGFENLKAIGRVIEKIAQGEAAAIDALLSGEEQEINKLSGSARVAMEMGVELFAELMLEIDNLPDYDKGKIVGRVYFEVAAILLPWSKIGQAAKLTKMKALELLAERPFFQSGAVAAAMARLSKLRTYLGFAHYASDGKWLLNVSRAERINVELGLAKPPFKLRTWVVSTVSQREVKYVRLYTEGTSSGLRGGWLARLEDIAGKTPEQIRDLLGLPHVPSHAAYVTVPQKTKLLIGEAAAQTWDDGVHLSGGGTQIRLRSEIPNAAFDNAPKATLTPGQAFDATVFEPPTP